MTYSGGMGGSGQALNTTQTDKERRDEADRILKILDREHIINLGAQIVGLDSRLTSSNVKFLEDTMAGGEVTPKQLFYLRDLKDKLLS